MKPGLQNRLRAILEIWAQRCIKCELLPFFLLAYPQSDEAAKLEFFALPHIDLRKELPDLLERLVADLRSGAFDARDIYYQPEA